MGFLAFISIYKSLIISNWIIILTYSLVASFANASIHIYRNEAFKDVGNSYLLSGGSEGIAARPHATSYIRFDNITFWRTKAAAEEHSNMEHSTGLVQVVIFEAADRNDIGGSAYGGQRSICCTPDLAKLEGCKQGEVIRIPSATDVNWPIVLNVQFSGNYLSVNIRREEIPITKTGMYNLFFIACDPKLKGLIMSGRTVWKNPDGYLPGRMAPLMKFYVYMSFAYLLLLSIWFVQYTRFWKDILQLQHCITAVIALGLFEMVLWYSEYANFNSMGVRPVVITTWVVTIGAVRKMLSRLLVLSISMGYGVVRPTLGGLTSKVLLLGLTYFLASELLDITEYVGTINDVSGRARLFLVLPDALLDAFLVLWIFTSLSRTLEQLQVKRSTVKLEIYRKFSNVLAATVIASVAWIAYENIALLPVLISNKFDKYLGLSLCELVYLLVTDYFTFLVYFKATDPFNERWQSAWIITAFWDILAFVLLCVICYLWAPSQNSQRYAYSDDIGEEQDDEEAQSLTGGKVDGHIGLVEKKERNGESTGALNDDDETQEDKRE